MKKTTDVSFEAVRKNYTLVNKSNLLSLAKTATLCLLKNINMNKKTEIEPVWWLFATVFFWRLIKLLNFKI